MSRNVSADEAKEKGMTGPFNINQRFVGKVVRDGQRLHLVALALNPKGKKSCCNGLLQFDGSRMAPIPRNQARTSVLEELKEAAKNLRKLPHLQTMADFISMKGLGRGPGQRPR